MKVRVTLTRDLSFHDDGKRTNVKIGDTIEVSEQSADTLISRGWAKPAVTEPPKKER